MIEITNSNIPKSIKNIIHISDIHIRNVRRHLEYQEQFKKLYSDIVQYDPTNTIVVISGDIAHAKTDMSPELVREISSLLTELSKLYFVLVFPGNHDANLNNTSRLDALTPIIDNLRNERVVYIKESGLYKMSGLYLNLMSVFDTSDRYLDYDKIKEVDGYKIGLYHGPVTNAKTDMGFNITGHLNIDFFNGHDIVILGDIHKKQVLQEYSNSNIKKPRIEYAGSLIQQNFGEDYRGHGYVVWDLEKRDSKFINIDSDYGFHTLYIENDKLQPYDDFDKITPKSRVRIKIINSDKVIVKDIISKVKQKFKVDDIAVINTKPVSNKKVSDIKILESSISDIGYQNSLILEYLEQTGTFIDSDIQKAIFDINKETNNNIVLKTLHNNVLWVPKKFEFSNMFSYGEGNVIDFTTLKGITGLFGQNATGKSALLDALCFCLFDKTSRAYKAEQVLNTRKEKFKCKLEFEVDGKSYFIEKIGYNYKKPGELPKIKVDINFWTTDDDGTIKFLNGDERRGTNQIIQEYVGSYDDFIITNLAMQESSANFINKSQSERKELLARFLNLEIFDLLYKNANDSYKDIAVSIKNLDKLNLNDELRINQTKLNTLQSDLTRHNFIESQLEKDESKLLKLADTHKRNIKQIQIIDIDTVLKDKAKLEVAMAETTKNDDILKKNIVKFELNKKNCSDELALIDIPKIESSLLLMNKYQTELAVIESKLQSKNKDLDYKQSILDKLKNHKYDPNCQYCIDNPFVKDAVKIKDTFNLDVIEKNTYVIKINEVQLVLRDLPELEAKKSKYLQLKSQIVEDDTSIKNCELSRTHGEMLLEKCLDKYNQLTELEKKYHDNQELIEKNKLNNAEILKIEDQIAGIKSQLKTFRTEISSITGNIKYLENTIESIQTNIQSYIDLVAKSKAYEIYLKAVNKEGLPYYMISKLLPSIEDEINNILSNMVDFKITLDMDGKNINSYIVYDDNYWPLELCSGMERFISSMGFRIALSNISAIPRPNFFALDEGLGVLDSTNLNSIYLLFNYMREIYDFTMIISHIDSVRDMVDTSITISNKEGNSFISLT